MLSFLIRRLLWMAATLWVVFTVSFALMRAVPGGPLSRERELDPAIERLMRQRYRLDEPVLQQYGRELWNAVRGDLGRPYRRPDFTTNEIIAQGFPWVPWGGAGLVKAECTCPYFEDRGLCKHMGHDPGGRCPGTGGHHSGLVATLRYPKRPGGRGG